MIYDSDGFERQPQIGENTLFSQGAKQGCFSMKYELNETKFIDAG